jgi:hypothetical protein
LAREFRPHRQRRPHQQRRQIRNTGRQADASMVIPHAPVSTLGCTT